MRILKLRLCNLNSLSGEWEIDFTQPEYINEGLFAITGPTGAGKSTILDAICLALYGQTPRLGRITKADNDMMARHHGECFAEVCFATDKGQYRAYWYQHRARKSAEGSLQNARHELSDLTTGAILEEKLSAVPPAIEALSGLDFDRFTRSVLLAQGQFAAFLHADDSQRSALLEQLTGTDVYAHISKLVFATYKQHQETLSQLKSRLDDIDLLSAEQIEQVRAQQSRQEASIEATEQDLARCQQLQDAVTQLSSLQHTQAQLNQRALELEQQQQQFVAQQTLLDADRQVRPYAAELRQFDYLRQQQDRVLKQHEHAAQRLSKLQPELAQAKVAYEHAQATHQQQVHAFATVEPELDAAATLEQKIDVQTQRLNDLEQQRQKLGQYQQTATQNLARHQRIEQDLNTQLAAQQAKLQQSAGADLVAPLAVLEQHIEQLTQLQTQQRKLLTQQQQSSQQAAAIAAMPVAEAQQQQLEAHQKELGRLGEALNQLDSQCQRLYVERKFAEQRDVLVKGEPCPLCGANEHPHLTHDSGQHAQDATNQLSQQISQLEQQRAALKQQLNQHQQSLQALNVEQALSQSEQAQQLNLAQQRTEELAQQLSEINHQVTKLGASWQSTADQLEVAFEPAADGDAAAMLRALQQLQQLMQQAQQGYQAAHSQYERIKLQRQDNQQQIQTLSTQLSTQQQQITEIAQQVTECQQALQPLKVSRAQYFDGRSVADVKAQYREGLRDSEQTLERVRQEYETAREQQRQVQSERDHLQQRLAEIQQELDSLMPALEQAQQQLGYSNHSEGNLHKMQSALLEQARFDALQQQAQSLRQREMHIRDQQQQLSTQLRECMDKQPSDAQGNLAQLQQHKSELSELQQGLGALKQRLLLDQQAREKSAHIVDEITAQQALVQDWATLNSLIGSQDGKNYRNFAQGLTFAVMIAYANEKLEKMTDRYRLIHDHMQGLHVNVMDDYQGGEIRTTKNLSGGESFLVSLALALGMAQMASSRVRVDSLFLDEGFGTLDPETLEVALDSLASLRQDGKMIGLISHVGALQERIPTQLQVTLGSAGRSRLSGPGVRQLAR